MYLRESTARITGLFLIAMAIGVVIVVIASTAGSSEYSPLKRGEVAQYLTDVNDKQTAVLATGAVGIVVDGFIGVAVAALLYLLFRDRSRLLATLALAGLLVQAGISLLADGNNIVIAILARDYAEGGPAGIAAGDPSLLEAGRYAGIVGIIFTSVLFVPLGLGLIALGWLIARAPAGAINPPRWLGWVAVVGGVCAELAWTIFVTDTAIVFYISNLVTSLVFLFGLGSWLIRHPDAAPAV
ncbi:MAG: DUF4386 family protein [Chloroflexota bacterium]